MFSIKSITGFFRKSTGNENMAIPLPIDDPQSENWFLVYNAPYGKVEISVLATDGNRVQIAYVAGGQVRNRWVDNGELKWVYPAKDFVYSKFSVDGFNMVSVAA